MLDGAETPSSDYRGPYQDSVGGGLFDLCCATFGAIRISYTLNLPDPGPNPPSELVLTVPFRAFGELTGFDGQGNRFYMLATGVGNATVTLDHAVQNTYFLESAQYDFFAVPEPATMTLAGLGVLAVIGLRRRAASAGARTWRTSPEKHPADRKSA